MRCDLCALQQEVLDRDIDVLFASGRQMVLLDRRQHDRLRELEGGAGPAEALAAPVT